ncbi:hypothetical protein [Veillonella agrestimuris]|uniref:hypothetical protein n=1 Tax=Veillonella agrestimuris TaxID=2941340 RepID=UPI00203C5316|nr:hypothetical protein [Veillonella agrestimuris]
MNIPQNPAEEILKDSFNTGISILDFLHGGLPIFESLTTAVKLIHNIPNQVFMYKFCKFIVALNSNHDVERFKEKYKKKYIDKKDQLNDDLKWIIICLDSINEEDKAYYIGHLFYNFIVDKIDWNTFKEFSIAVDRLLSSDLETLLTLDIKPQEVDFTNLETLYKNARDDTDFKGPVETHSFATIDKYLYLRLLSAGFVNIENEVLTLQLMPKKLNTRFDRRFRLFLECIR